MEEIINKIIRLFNYMRRLKAKLGNKMWGSGGKKGSEKTYLRKLYGKMETWKIFREVGKFEWNDQ